MTKLVESVSKAIEGNMMYVVSKKEARFFAQAAIAAMLEAVESNLSAVQYDPAPYTAMKARLAQMKKEAGL